MRDLPRMTASQAADLASCVARHLAASLDDINRQYPAVDLDPEFQDIIDQAHAGTLPGPVPQQFIPVFERLFLAHMASRHVIVPD